jgi:hypothetical protein
LKKFKKKYPSATVDSVKVETYSKKKNQIGMAQKVSIKAPGQYHTIYLTA